MYNRTPLAIKRKKKATDVSYDMDEYQGHEASESRQILKAINCVFPLMGRFWKGKTIGTESRSEVSRGWSVGRTLSTKRHRNTSGGMEIFYILMW